MQGVLPYVLLLSIALSLIRCTPGSSVQPPDQELTTPIVFDQTEAGRLAQLALHCIDTEYPYKPGHTLGDSSYLREPIDLHPAFYGCFDWHSAVHGHWSLIKVLKLFPDVENAAEMRRKLNQNITTENIQIEINYFDDKHNKNFERTYGWAWLLKLSEELNDWDDPDGKRWARALQPLADLMVDKYLEFLPKLLYPIRVGEHSNTAFGLSFAWDYAVATNHQELMLLIEERARDFYFTDADCPLGWEPSGFDFLSPCLEEMEIMARILPEDEFGPWFDKFIVDMEVLKPAEVSDRTDGKLVHLDGLNFSRAWCLYRAADKRVENSSHLRNLADQHLLHSLTNVRSGDYAGEHWLASFALYALSQKP